MRSNMRASSSSWDTFMCTYQAAILTSYCSRQFSEKWSCGSCVTEGTPPWEGPELHQRSSVKEGQKVFTFLEINVSESCTPDLQRRPPWSRSSGNNPGSFCLMGWRELFIVSCKIVWTFSLFIMTGKHVGSLLSFTLNICFCLCELHENFSSVYGFDAILLRRYGTFNKNHLKVLDRGSSSPVSVSSDRWHRVDPSSTVWMSAMTGGRWWCVFY